MRKQNGFSLVEILVSSIIFSLIIVGLASVFIAARMHIIHTRERVISAQIGKLFVDPLQMEVRQDTWDSNNLDLSGPTPPVLQRINNRDFSSSNTVAAVANTDLRRVTTTITWTEPNS